MNEDVYVGPNVMKMYTIPYAHYTTIGTIIGLVVGLVISLLFLTDQKIYPKLLTPFVRKLMYPEHTAISNDYDMIPINPRFWVVYDEYINYRMKHPYNISIFL